MHIKISNQQVRSLKRPFMDEPVEFASTGTAQVSREVGERLVEEVDKISEYESESE